MKKKGFSIFPIGKVERSEKEISLKLEDSYQSGLKKLDQFSHVIVIWWAHKHDNKKDRLIMETVLPYAKNTKAGVFACRSEYRPNPIAATVCPISEINIDENTVKIKGIDAVDGTPILDLKPYIPVCDKVDDFKIPDWFKGWPTSLPEDGLQLN